MTTVIQNRSIFLSDMQCGFPQFCIELVGANSLRDPIVRGEVWERLSVGTCRIVEAEAELAIPVIGSLAQSQFQAVRGMAGFVVGCVGADVLAAYSEPLCDISAHLVADPSEIVRRHIGQSLVDLVEDGVAAASWFQEVFRRSIDHLATS